MTRQEDRLLLLACRPGADLHGEADRLVTRDLDWDYLMATAIDNRIVIPLWKGIRRSPHVPASVRQSFVGHDVAVHRRVAACKAAFEHVLPIILQSTDVILLRGIAYAYTIHREKITRTIGDLDLLINRPMYRSVSGRLVDHHHVPDDIQRACPIKLEYHHDLNVNSSWCSRIATIRMAELWERRQCIVVAGHSVGTLTPEDSVIYLSYHNVTKGFVRLYRWADMLCLIRHSSMDWDAVIERSRRYRLSRAVWINCLMLNIVQPDSVPVGVMTALRPARSIAWTAGRLLSVTRVLHDPNTVRQRSWAGDFQNAMKGLLVRVILVRPPNVHKVVFGTMFRYLFFLYAWPFQWPLVGRMLRRLRMWSRRSPAMSLE